MANEQGGLADIAKAIREFTVAYAKAHNVEKPEVNG